MLSRRDLLRRTGTGLGLLGLAALLAEPGLGLSTARADDDYHNPLAPREPHFPAKAKHVIHIFLNGGPSHVDTFDPKPALAKYAGQGSADGEPANRTQDGCRVPFAIQVPEVRAERDRGQ